MGNWLRHIYVAFAAGSLALASMAQATTTTAYQLLLQSRVDTAAPNEVYLASFASLDDVITETIGSPTGFTDIDVTPDYQIAGMTWDGAAYRVLLQSRADTAAPAEVFLASFATLDDLFSETLGSPTDFTQIDVAPAFQIVGFSSVTTVMPPPPPPPPAVPEPATWSMMIIGVGATGFVMRRRGGVAGARA
jgi:hypothetical protein